MTRFKTDDEIMDVLEGRTEEEQDYVRKEPKIGTKIVEGIVVGRDKKVISPEEVQHLASLGCTNREIAGWLEINEDTLRYNFKSFLEKGRSELNHKLRRAQITTALAGNATLLIWLGKQYLQQSDQGAVTDQNQILPWTDSDIEEVKTQAEEDLESIEDCEDQ